LVGGNAIFKVVFLKNETIIQSSLLFNPIYMIGFGGMIGSLTGKSFWMLVLAGCNALFALAIFAGLVLLFIWAYKSMEKDQLKKMTKLFLIVGIVGMFLTVTGMYYEAKPAVKSSANKPSTVLKGNLNGTPLFNDLQGIPNVKAPVVPTKK
jgi:fluoride ion exporter CrcB/FEX